MVNDRFVEMIRRKAFPLGSPEGPEYERTCIRDWLVAIARHTAGKRGTGHAIEASRDEAARVFRACWDATFTQPIEDCPSVFTLEPSPSRLAHRPSPPGDVPDRILGGF
jgi:hypothetical protein